MSTEHIDRIFLGERTPESKAQYYKDRWQEAFLENLALQRREKILHAALSAIKRFFIRDDGLAGGRSVEIAREAIEEYQKEGGKLL